MLELIKEKIYTYFYVLVTETQKSDARVIVDPLSPRAAELQNFEVHRQNVHYSCITLRTIVCALLLPHFSCREISSSTSFNKWKKPFFPST